MTEDEPASYLTLREGTAVQTRDGVAIGKVSHVLADPNSDIFDGLVIDGGGRHCFADGSQVASIDTGLVTLTVDSQAAERLPEPTENPAALSAGPGETVPDDLGDKLRRAWQLLSGAG
jgi:hypothetical protein